MSPPSACASGNLDGDAKPKESAKDDADAPGSSGEQSAPSTLGSASTQRSQEKLNEQASAPIPEETSGLRRHDSIPPSVEEDSLRERRSLDPPIST